MEPGRGLLGRKWMSVVRRETRGVWEVSNVDRGKIGSRYRMEVAYIIPGTYVRAQYRYPWLSSTSLGMF